MSLNYDFTFVDFAIKFLETGDAEYLGKISESKAAGHIFSHAQRFNPSMLLDSPMELATNLLTPVDKHREKLPQVIRNIDYAKKHIASTGIAEKIALQCLPKGFAFSGSIFFTFGYDIGVAYGENCSLNLAHPIFSENMDEMKYYAIHELHHAGFIAVKNGYMPSFEISTRREMAYIIEYLTHLEGMGTYAPFGIREHENALNSDGDYIALQNLSQLDGLTDEYFEIYKYFADNPSEALIEADWQKVEILSDAKRLWYIVGAHMAKTIDQRLGREKLTDLICEPSINFIATYLGFGKN